MKLKRRNVHGDVCSSSRFVYKVLFYPYTVIMVIYVCGSLKLSRKEHMSPRLHNSDKIAPLSVGAKGVTTHKLYHELSNNDTNPVSHPQPQTFTDTMALYSLFTVPFTVPFLYRSPLLATRNHHLADQSQSTFNMAALILAIALPFIMIGSGVF